MQKSLFGSRELGLDEESRLKNDFFDIRMNPREWMARYGYTILCGDCRMFKIQDNIFKTWVYQAFEALHTEGLEKLWEEFLDANGILIISNKFNNP